MKYCKNRNKIKRETKNDDNDLAGWSDTTI